MAFSPIKLRFNDRDLMRRLHKTDKSVRTDAASKGLRAGSNFLISRIQKNITEKPLVDKGELRASVTEDELHLGKVSYVMFGPHKVYAAIHEFGGVIRPTKGEFLWFRNKEGKLIKTRSVTMPARPYIRPAIDEHGDEALRLVGETIGSVLEGKWT